MCLSPSTQSPSSLPKVLSSIPSVFHPSSISLTTVNKPLTPTPRHGIMKVDGGRTSLSPKLPQEDGMYELINVAKSKRHGRKHETIESAKAAAELNYAECRRPKGLPNIVWHLGCKGGSDEHWQGFEPHYKKGNGKIIDRRKEGLFEEASWVIPIYED